MNKKSIGYINKSLVGFYFEEYKLSIQLEGAVHWKYIYIDLREEFPSIAPSKEKETQFDIRDSLGINVEQYSKNGLITKLNALTKDTKVDINCIKKTIEFLKLLKG